MEKVQVLSPAALTHALAGAAGAEVATLAFYPLDLLLTRVQNSDRRKGAVTSEIVGSLLKNEGILGMYRGLIPNMEAVLASNLTYFYSYHAMRRLVNRSFASGALPASPLVNLLVGAFAAVVNVLLTTPLWVANTRLKLQRRMGQDEEYHGLLHTVVRIYREEGLRTLWGSVVPSLILICNPSIHFAVYETVKTHLLRRTTSSRNSHQILSASQAFLLGAFAKICATLLTYPIQVAQSRLRAENRKRSAEGSSESYGTFSLLRRMYKDGGLASWYRGIGVKLAQSTLTSALMFLVYERIRVGVIHLFRRQLSFKTR